MIDVYASNTDSKPDLKTPACVCTTVKKLSRVLGRVYDSALAASGINVTQFAVMRSIARHNGEPLAHIAAELKMDRTSLYRAIAPMVREGWVGLADGADARSRSARVTRKGSRMLEKAAGNWEQVQDDLIGAFGHAEWSALNAELYRLSECARMAAGE
jgi:DNA-binding MarR family transcriptional regulator